MKHGWQLYSISRWSKENGKRLQRHLEIEFEEKKNRQIYWDDVALFCYPSEYQLGIVEMNHSDGGEIDSLDELKTIDPCYVKIQKESSTFLSKNKKQAPKNLPFIV